MKETPFVRSPYNYDMNKAGDDSGLKCLDASLTQQHLADETDINKLVERFVVTGEIPQLTMPPLQGDFTNVPTYQEALNLMRAADASFMQLDAKIRSQFDNDPGKFVDFASDEKNATKLREWHLLSPESDARFATDTRAAEELQRTNAAAAEELKTLKKGTRDTTKGVT